jgi:short-subunit dehydrogenase
MYQGKVAIVTGASSGIGLSLARKLAFRGARVALVARTKSTLEEVAREIGGTAFALDVRDLGAVASLPGRVVDALGRIDFLVNNAGMNHRGEIARRSVEQLADIVTANLTAPIVLTRAALEHLKPGGAVVNVASLAGMVPLPGEAAYSASKAGLRAFTRAVAEELEAKGIHCGCVSPGPVDTGFFQEIDDVPNLVFSQPMKSADEVADAVLACIERRAPEVAIPAASGRLATFAYLFPSVARGIRPLLEKRGERAKRAYIARKSR